MNVQKLQEALDTLKTDLDGALLSSVIWEKKSGLSMVSYNPNDKGVALIGRLTNEMESSLNDLGFPPFGKYQITDLDMDAIMLIINSGDYIWGNLIDKSKVTLGFLINIAMPKADKMLSEAING